MSPDPFLIQGPAVLSISGGRTSGYMLWRILQAHGGVLPEDVVAAFANTGREMPATLDFVRDMADAWDVPIVWVEFRRRHKDGFAVVDHATASRHGEPFDALLATMQALPNPVQRSCTQEMKIRTIKRWVLREMHWSHWINVVGLRADEKRRVEKVRATKRRERWTVTLPLADAGVVKADVLDFWKGRNFDLRLAGPWEGNCDGCMLKSKAAVQRMFLDHPERMAWWADKEAQPRGSQGVNRWFRNDRPGYAALRDEALASMFPIFDETFVDGGEACDGGCGI